MLLVWALSAGESKRAHIVCVGSYAEDDDSTQEGSKQQLWKQWGSIDAEVFQKKASRADIHVTSGKDKDQQLEKLKHLPDVLTKLHKVSRVGEQVPRTISSSGHGYLRDVCRAVNIIALRWTCCCDDPIGRSSMRNNNPWDHF